MAAVEADVQNDIKNETTNNDQSGVNGGGNQNFSGRGRGRRFQGGNRRFDGPNNRRSHGNPNETMSGEGGQGGRGEGGRGGGGGGGQRGMGGGLERIMFEKLNSLCGSTYDLPPLDQAEKKFSGRSRLYIGNIPPETTEDEVNELFQKFGETSELFINKEKNFGFIRMDYHYSAEKAKGELNGFVLKNRTLKIRFAPNGSTIKVRNIDDFCTNELLFMAFSVFGEVDRAVVIVDDRGKPTGEGIVEFARKPSAQFAIRKCCEGCFFVTSNLRPVMVEAYDAVDEVDGYPEKTIVRKNQDYYNARSVGPRFASSDSFEHEYGLRWKQLYELYAQKEEAMKKDMAIEKEKLIAEMEYARYEHETAMLREQLRAREMDMDRHKREWEIKEKKAEEARARQEEFLSRQEQEMATRMLHQDEEMRRRQQENSLFMQAHQLDSMLEQQEQQYNDNKDGGDRPDPKAFLSNYERNSRFEGRKDEQRGMRGRGHWGNDRGNREDFQAKRRRF